MKLYTLVASEMTAQQASLGAYDCGIDDMSVDTSAAITLVAVRQGKVTTTHDASGLHGLLADGESRVWIDLTDPAPEVVESIAASIGLHPLVAEDIIESNERAKVELVGDVVHVVMFALTRPQRIQSAEIDLVLGERFLLSVHPASWDPTTVHELRLGIGTVLGQGVDFLLWALLDSIVDDYFPILDLYGDEIDDVQDEIMVSASKEALHRVFDLKRELIRLRHIVHPSREVVSRLAGREFELIGDPQIFYFRDVYDHLIMLGDEFDNLRELVAGALEVYLSTVNNNLSVIMKRLTGVTVVLAGIGAVGGLFGMSQATPAISGAEGVGFWAITISTLVLAACAVAFLRWIDWI
jgi:magnesium transporter